MIEANVRYGLQPGSGSLNSILDESSLPSLILGIVIKLKLLGVFDQLI